MHYYYHLDCYDATTTTATTTTVYWYNSTSVPLLSCYSSPPSSVLYSTNQMVEIQRTLDLLLFCTVCATTLSLMMRACVCEKMPRWLHRMPRGARRFCLISPYRFPIFIVKNAHACIPPANPPAIYAKVYVVAATT